MSNTNFKLWNSGFLLLTPCVSMEKMFDMKSENKATPALENQSSQISTSIFSWNQSSSNWAILHDVLYTRGLINGFETFVLDRTILELYVKELTYAACTRT